MSNKRKTGTREWAESNYNIGIGCVNNCLYCYARTATLRNKTIDSYESWTSERLKTKLPSIGVRSGWIMFPTTTDISLFYLPTAVDSLKKMLSNGNKVLIVTKPRLECIKTLCKELEPWKSNILFRFTIGTPYNERAKFWESGAPSITERLDCLMYAFDKGYATSISMEPMLGTVEETLAAATAWMPFITDKIWIGKMNKINLRVNKSSPDIETACNDVVECQNDENIMWLVNKLKDDPKIEWKDSIKEVIEKYN